MSNIVEYTPDQIGLIKRTIAKEATDDELALFLNQAKRTGLDPLTRQIYFYKDQKGKVTIMSSIDGLRLVADRSGKYQGQTKPEWCGDDGIWKDIWLSTEPPMAARIGVWKELFREPAYGVALFDEYCGRYQDGNLTFMWKKMPALMIAKVAEALALRKAFPNDLSGIYTNDEITIQSDEMRNDRTTETTKSLEVTAKQEVKDKPEEQKTSQTQKPSFSKPELSDNPVTASSYTVVNLGKNKGKTFHEVGLNNLLGLVDWLMAEVSKSKKPLGPAAVKFVEEVNIYEIEQNKFFSGGLTNEEIPK